MSVVFPLSSAVLLSTASTTCVAGTGLYELWKRGLYRNYAADKLVDLVARVLALVPPWVCVCVRGVVYDLGLRSLLVLDCTDPITQQGFSASLNFFCLHSMSTKGRVLKSLLKL